MKTICIFAASSSRIDGAYSEAASLLGRLIAGEGFGVVYGGGGIGLMGKLADAVLESNGNITGVIPAFMVSEGWGHPGLASMVVTTDMGERKKTMLERSDAVIALPGGIGTLEELTEAITLKQLGLFKGPIIILNTLGYYDPFIELLDHMVKGHFMRLEHKGIWEVVETPGEAIAAIKKYEGWIDDPRQIARIH
ncbi:MAG: TIGR00730 family Rossman fold protein [Bacteroidales bacterium]